MNNGLEWVTAVGALLSAFVAIVALVTSRNALTASKSVADLDRTIKLALAEFREELGREKLLINNDVIDYRFKGEDDKIYQLDHRISRTQEQVTMILKALLEAGVMRTKQNLPPSTEG